MLTMLTLCSLDRGVTELCARRWCDFFLWCVYWTPVDESCDNRSSRWCLTTPRWLCVCVCVCLRFEPVNSKHRLCLHTLWTPNGVCRVLLFWTVFVFIFLQLWCGCWHSFPSLPAVSEEIWSSAPSQAFPLLGVMEFGRERLPDQKVGQTVGIVFYGLVFWGRGEGEEGGEGVKPSTGFSKVRRAWWFPKFFCSTLLCR